MLMWGFWIKKSALKSRNLIVEFKLSLYLFGRSVFSVTLSTFDSNSTRLSIIKKISVCNSRIPIVGFKFSSYSSGFSLFVSYLSYFWCLFSFINSSKCIVPNLSILVTTRILYEDNCTICYKSHRKVMIVVNGSCNYSALQG